VLATLLVALSGCLTDAHSRGDELARPSGPPSPGAAGSLISATPAPGAPAGISAWRVLYHSRDQHGADVEASGVVLSPAAGHGIVPAGGRPVIAFGHGTTGVADACAPSESQPPLSGLASTFGLAQQGYVVAAADYIGLGTPGDSAIYVARLEGQALLDVVRAARALPAAHAGTRAIIWGYSQGGGGALAAGIIAARYAPDLQLRGVVAMAPLADLPRSLASLVAGGGSGVAYLLLAAYGASVADPSINLRAALTGKGRRLLNIVRQKCALDLLAATSGVSVGQVFTHNPLTTQPFAAAFAAQRTAAIGSMAPVLLLQGDADDVIRQPITDEVARSLCAAHTVVDYHRYAMANHASIFDASTADMDAWIASRLVTTPAAVHDICHPTL
jgi:predicted esterase